ncbi:unnamed protein product [Clonostachys chloroleuca]|uniref:Uncharacterized protein n=1 Tax=Clonostachys chloroleuca TaxID=1926264 RepID=A0AA35LW44_9HYPO|nr:unnamed protein product [Clonostachys chloroleuca]
MPFKYGYILGKRGYVITSIVESLHGQMKRFLWSTKGDFDTIIDHFNNFWEYQILNIMNIHSLRHYKISTFSIQPLYLPIRERVLSHALKILEIEHQAVELKLHRDILISSQGCVCEKAVAWGLLYRHIIYSRLVNNKPLSLDDFDPHWYWKSYATVQAALFEPAIIQPKGRPRGSLNLDKTRSTRRDPSRPLSTAPANLETLPLTGLAYIKQFGDNFEPGTQAPRMVQRFNIPPDEEDAEHKTLKDHDIRVEEEREDTPDD